MLPDVLAAKLELPRLPPSLAPRERLVQKLTGGLREGHKALILTAPDGFGKTTLLANWLAGLGRAYAWLSLTKDEDDPASFLMHLAAALQKVQPEMGAGLQGAWLASDLNLDRLMMTLIAHLARQQPEFILVLDDYHRIHSSQIHRLVGLLLDHSPASLRIAIASSAEPPLPLTAYRAGHLLTELRAADLSFTRGEIQDFIRRFSEALPPPDKVQAIQKCCGGWPAGVNLAAQLICAQEALPSEGVSPFDASSLPVAGARPGEVNDEAVAFLLQAVFEQQPEAIRKALLRASILEWMPAPLLSPLSTDDPSSGEGSPPSKSALLPPLQSFLFAHTYAGWARFHPYWHEFLSRQLHSSVPFETIARYHAAASRFFEQRGEIDEAAIHALAAQDEERVAALIENEIDNAFWRQARAFPLRRYLNRVPKPFLAAHPRLALKFAQALFVLEDFLGAECCLQFARQGSEGLNGENGLRAELAVLQACFLRVRGEAGLFVELATHKLAQQSDRSKLSTLLLLHSLGLALVQAGDLPKAREKLEKAYSLALDSRNVVLQLIVLLQLARIEIISGRLQAVEEVCLQGLRLCSAVGETVSFYAGLLDVTLGDVYFEWNRFEDAARHYQAGLRRSAYSGHQVSSFACSRMVRLLTAQGEADKAGAWMQAARELEQLPAPINDRPLAGVVAALEIRRGILEAAFKDRIHLPAENELEEEDLRTLTTREQAVLALIASGLSYEETAGKLVITVNTVRTHVKSIYRKLGVSSRRRAVQEASRLGILSC